MKKNNGLDLRIDSQDDKVCHLSLSGRISQTLLGSSGDQLSQLLGEANYDQNILLSLQKTDYIDSSGIGWLLATDKKIRAAGGKLVLHSLPSDVQHIFGIMNLNTILNVVKDKQQANQVVAGGSANAN